MARVDGHGAFTSDRRRPRVLRGGLVVAGKLTAMSDFASSAIVGACPKRQTVDWVALRLGMSCSGVRGMIVTVAIGSVGVGCVVGVPGEHTRVVGSAGVHRSGYGCAGPASDWRCGGLFIW